MWDCRVSYKLFGFDDIRLGRGDGDDGIRDRDATVYLVIPWRVFTQPELAGLILPHLCAIDIVATGHVFSSVLLDDSDTVEYCVRRGDVY